MYTSHICHSLSVFTDYQIYHGDRPRSEEKERLICIYRSRRNRWHSGFVKTFDYKTLNEEQEEEGIKCRERVKTNRVIRHMLPEKWQHRDKYSNPREYYSKSLLWRM